MTETRPAEAVCLTRTAKSEVTSVLLNLQKPYITPFLLLSVSRLFLHVPLTHSVSLSSIISESLEKQIQA